MALVAQLAVAVVLDDRGVVAGGPGQQLHPPRDRHRPAVRVLPRRGDHHGGRSVRQAVDLQAAVVDRDVDQRHAERLEHPLEVRAARILERQLRARPPATVAPRWRGRSGRRPSRPPGRPSCAPRGTSRGRPRARPAAAGRPPGSDRSSRRPGPRRGRATRAAAGAPRARPGTGRGGSSRSGSRTAARTVTPPKNGRRGPVGQTAGRVAPPALVRTWQPAPEVRQARRDDRAAPRVAARGSPPRSAARRRSSPSRPRRRGASRRPGCRAGPRPDRSGRPGSTVAGRPRSGGRAAGSRPGRGRSAERARRALPSLAFPIHTAARRPGFDLEPLPPVTQGGVPIRTPTRWERSGATSARRVPCGSR